MTAIKRLERALVAALKEHLSTGRPPVVPEAGRLWWQLFGEVGRARTYHQGGPNPIAYAEIEAFCRLKRWPLEPHHLDVILALDEAWLEHSFSRINQPTSGKTIPRSSGQAISPALFDLAVT